MDRTVVFFSVFAISVNACNRKRGPSSNSLLGNLYESPQGIKLFKLEININVNNLLVQLKNHYLKQIPLKSLLGGERVVPLYITSHEHFLFSMEPSLLFLNFIFFLFSEGSV